MSIRAIQSGVISFGLVNIPVKVYSSGDSSRRISFHQLHGEKKTRLKQQMFDPETGEVVPREKIVKGYEFAKDQYVIVSDEELEAVAAASDKQMRVSEFVPAESITPAFFDTLYYLGPDKGAERAFRLLATAMKETGRVAVVQYVARGREHLAAVIPMGDGLALLQLRYSDEVRDPNEVPIPAAEVNSVEVALAKQLIEALSSPFDPKKYKDEYAEKLRLLIDKKVKGETVAFAAEPKAPTAPTVDLTAMLKASLAKSTPASAPVETAPAKTWTSKKKAG